MKYLLTISCVILFVTTSAAQINDKLSNTIDVQGNSRILANPSIYSAYILIEEEEQKVGYTTIGKLLIDSIKINLITNLKKFGIDVKDLKLIGTSSKAIGQYPNYLTNIAYELKLKDKEVGSKLLNEMRFTGLKGIVIKREFTQAQKNTLSDSLYNSAINDAKRIATEFAKKENRSIGEMKTIELRLNTLNNSNFYSDDNFNTYAFNKFEMDYRDKYANCVVRIVFEMK
jgi:uncharacterized protein YggE